LLVEYGLLIERDSRYYLPADDLYFMHTHSQLHFLENNLTYYLSHALKYKEESIVENVFLRLPASGLKEVRSQLIDPFLHEQLLPLSDQKEGVSITTPYNKQMYALLLIGTHRLSPHVHSRLSLEERISHYFKEACLQRVIRQQKHQAICLQATLMLDPNQALEAHDHVLELKESLRQHLPQGRGNKPNFNQTVCFTRVPLSFNRNK